MKTYKKDFFIFLLFFIHFFVFQISYFYMNFDDAVNFHFIQGILNGYMPYKELNTLLPPLFYYSGALFLKLFGIHIYSFYVFGSVMTATTSFLVYRFFKNTIDTKFIYLFGFSFVFMLLTFLGLPNYNMLFLLLQTLLVIVSYKASLRQKSSDDYIIGIILGLCTITKHSYAFFLIASYYLYKLILAIRSSDISTKKQHIKGILKTTVGGLFVAIALLLFLISNDIFEDFINICILGISDFINNSFFVIMNIIPIIVINCLISLASFYNYYKQKKDIFLFFALTIIFSTGFIFPEPNVFHVMMGSFASLLCLPLIIESFYTNMTYENAKTLLKRITISASVLLYLLVLVKTVYFALKLNYTHLELPYDIYGVVSPLDEEYYSKIENVVNYIKQKKSDGYNVYIISADGAPYYIPMNFYSKFDLIITGNLGYNGVERIIEDLANIDNPIFLKNTLGEACYQEPKSVEDFIVKNYKLIDNIEQFRVFSK